ncbi:MAG: YjzD family protein [Lactococcus lactis]|nr:YjzD family protein [Lactococcus lactis]
MGRYLVTILWSIIYMLVVGFIAGPLTQRASFNANDVKTCLIVGLIFGILFSAIIATITAHSHKDNSKYSKLK